MKHCFAKLLPGMALLCLIAQGVSTSTYAAGTSESGPVSYLKIGFEKRLATSVPLRINQQEAIPTQYFTSSSSADFAVSRAGLRLNLNIRDRQHSDQLITLRLVLPESGGPAELRLFGFMAAQGLSLAPGERLNCSSESFKPLTQDNEALNKSTAYGKTEPGSPWLLLHEVLLGERDIKSMAVSFRLECSNESVASISGTVAFDANPSVLVLPSPRTEPAPRAIAATAEAVQALENIGSMWVTAGQLIEYRLPKPEYGKRDSMSYELDGAVPVEAHLLSNPDGSQTLFWMPSARDIGSTTVMINRVDALAGADSAAMQLDVEVLSAVVSGDRLRAHPQISVEPSMPIGSVHEIEIGEQLTVRFSTKQESADAPYLNLKDVPASAVVERQSPDRGTVVWTPDEDDRGFASITAIAVDAENPRVYAARTINIKVLEASRAQRFAHWLDTIFEPLDGPQDNRVEVATSDAR